MAKRKRRKKNGNHIDFKNILPDTSLGDINSEDTISTSPAKQSFGPAPFYKVPLPSDPQSQQKPKFHSIPLHYPTHWWYRGEALRQLTQMEYAALVEICPYSHKTVSEETNNDTEDDVPELEQEDSQNIQKSNNTQSKPACGRKVRRIFPFHPNHPLFHSHYQCLRAKQPTLIFNANPPSFPGEPPDMPLPDATIFDKGTYADKYKKWSAHADRFAKFYDICFLPHEELFWTKRIHPISTNMGIFLF